MASNCNKRKRTSLSIEQKIQISRLLERGVSTSNLAAEYDVNPATVRRIRQKSATIENHIINGECNIYKKKKLRKPVNEDLDSRLHAWFIQCRALGNPVSDLVLRQKALAMNFELGGSSTFKASNGWLYSFKDRHGIRILQSFEGKESIDKATGERLVIKQKELTINPFGEQQEMRHGQETVEGEEGERKKEELKDIKQEGVVMKDELEKVKQRAVVVKEEPEDTDRSETTMQEVQQVQVETAIKEQSKQLCDEKKGNKKVREVMQAFDILKKHVEPMPSFIKKMLATFREVFLEQMEQEDE